MSRRSGDRRSPRRSAKLSYNFANFSSSWFIALSSSHVYVHSVRSGYTYSWSLHGWGWIELILGIVVFAAGVCVFLGMPWARYVGAFLAVLSAIGNFMFIPYTPVWSIILIVLDAFIIWALLVPRRVHGEF